MRTKESLLLAIVIVLLGLCRRLKIGAEPRIRTPIGNITVNYCTILKKVIPENAYFEDTPGQNITLRLLAAGSTAVEPGFPLLNFDSDTRTLYSVPTSKNPTQTAHTRGEWYYIIRATNPDTENFVDDAFWLKFVGAEDVNKRNYGYELENKVLQRQANDMMMLYNYVDKIFKFFNTEPTKKVIQVYDYEFLDDGRLNVYIQNCTLREDPCDDGNTERIFQALDSPEFSQALLPEFNKTKLTANKLDPCNIENLGPALSRESIIALWVTKTISLLIFVDPYPGMYQWDMPRLFRKEETTETYFIYQLQLLDPDNRSVQPNAPISYWAFIKSNLALQSNTMYITITDDTYNAYTAPYTDAGTEYQVVSLIINAIDSRNKDTRSFPTFMMPMPEVRYSFYSVQFNFTGFQTGGTDLYVIQTHIFLNATIRALGEYYRNLIFLNFFNMSSSTFAGTAMWSVKVYPGCNFTLIRQIRAIMFQSPVSEQNVNPTFVQSLASTFTLTSAAEFLRGKCKIEPPTIRREFPELSIPFCGIFTYSVPDDMFFDVQDGGTRNLSLTLLDSVTNTEVSPSSWINVDDSTQTVYAVVPATMATASQREFAYKLRVTDNSGESVISDVKVVITDNPKQIGFDISAKGKYTAGEANLTASYFLASKVSAWLNNDGKTFQLQEDLVTSQQQNYLTFSTCEWRYDPCDSVKIAAYKRKFFSAEGLPLPAFVNSLLPEFTDVTVSPTTSGPCQDDKKPNVGTQWGPFTFSSCKTFTGQVPADAFNDPEQGDSRQLDLTLSGTAPQPTELPVWMHFDSSTQTLRAIPYTGLTITEYTFTLSAFDINKRSAIQNIQATMDAVGSTVPEPSHIVEMTFKVVDSALANFVDIYSKFREDLKIYLGESGDVIQYITMTTGSVILSMKWTHCEISKTVCQTDAISNLESKLVLNGNPNPGLVQSVKDDFTIETLTFVMAGICITEKEPPVVSNPIPEQNIRYCSYFRYQVPANTFQDTIDGNTRNMKLSATYKESSSLPAWIAFDETKQEFIVVLQSIDPVAENITEITVTATTSRGLSVSTTLKFKLVDATPLVLEKYLRASGRVLSSGFTSTNPVILLNTYIDFLQKISIAFNLTESQLHYYVVKTPAFGSNIYITSSIINCQVKDCTQKEIPRLEPPLQYDASVFAPDFDISSPTVLGENKCGVGKKVPRVIQNIPPITISRCRTFREEVTAEVIEYEGGPFDELIFTVKTVNGAPINPQTTWIYMEKNFITGVVLHSVIPDNPSIKYNVTVGVSDPDGNEVVTWVLVTVSGQVPQLYFQYEMQVADKIARSTSLSVGLSRQISMTNLINTFFGYDIVDIVSYEDMVNNKFNLIWSVCPLPNSCTADGLTESENKMFNAGQPVSAFTDVFKPDFELEVLRKKISDFCTGPLNPPRATQDPLTVNLPYCGGFHYVIPEDLFTDVEDGNTRNLKLYFESSKGSPVSDTNVWLQFDQVKQEIKGMPLYVAAKLITETNKVFYLRAKDKSGLEKTIEVYLKFPLTLDPKFFFVVTISSPFNPSDVEKRFRFMDKLAEFRNDPDRKFIGFQSVKHTLNKIEVEVFNCSFTYSPCNLYELRKMKADFSDENGFPTAGFRDIMQPEFVIDYVQSTMLLPCGSPYPPTVIVTPPVLNISLCGMFNYIIPERTFYDTEQGYTRNLNLALTPRIGATFIMTSFVEFTASSQSMTVIPSASVLSAQSSQPFVFALTATDNTNLAAVTDLKVYIYGAYSILEECQIEMTLTRLSTSTHATWSNVQIMTYIIERLASFFQITREEIGVVKFTKLTTTNIVFAWSYCSAIYHTSAYSSNSAGLAVDYYNLLTRVLMKLFDNQRKLNTNFETAFGNQYKVDKVETKFTGRCRDLPPIATPSHTVITIRLQYGGYALYTYTDSYFYDFEDGGAFSLKLSFLTSSNSTVLIDYWINIDYTLYTIYAIVTDLVRASAASSAIFKYNLIATDTAGQSAVIIVNVVKYTTTLNFAPFNISYALQYNKESSMIYARQAYYLIDVINSYFTSVSSTYHVLVRWYMKTAGYSQYRIFTFSVANQDCSSQVLSTIKTAYTQGVLDASLISSVSQMFTLHRVYNETSCSNDPDPPSPVDPLPKFNISFCTVWTYNLPRTLFHDAENGETIGLKLSLLDSFGNPISSSSWFQLNTVTRQFYAVAIQSIFFSTSQTTFTYRIQASNSRRLSKQVSFSASVENKPYTSDCRMSMNFRYKYMTENIVDLDIIRTFIDMLSQYYGDSTEDKVKILSFVKFPDHSYNVTWSNCSFVFSTAAQALRGLSESDRQRITTIFSQVVSTSSNQIVERFKTFMSSYFVIMGISVSYDCIEEPPIPKAEGYRVFPRFCQLFNDSIPRTAFYDKRDGDTRNLRLKLLDRDEKEVNINNWVQLDASIQHIYGVVTEKVKDEAPLSGYKYYIQATDSSGRSAKLEYIIKIASPKKYFDVYFRTGFRNNYGVLTPTATMLYAFVDKLSKYIDPNDLSGKIYVKEFQYPSILLWSHCSLEASCTNQAVTSTLQKLRTTSGDITTEFASRMFPEFLPTQQRIELKNGRCGSSNITIIVNPPPPNTTLPTCGFFRLQVPASLFNDMIGRNTRYFYLNFLNNDNSSVGIDSWIRFNGPGQYVYGLNIISKTPVLSSYKIQAVMPDSGFTGYSPAIFRVSNYALLQSISSNLCWVQFHMSVFYNQLFDDVSLIEIFIKTLSTYLTSTVSQIQIFNYTRVRNEYPFRFTVTWTNCSMTTLFQQEQFSEAYYASYRSILLKFMVVSSSGKYTSMNQRVQNFFQQNSLMSLTSITTNGKCTIPDKTPPKPNKPVTIEIKCGMFKHRVPNDTFTDKEDGGTRQLTLTILQTNGSNLPADAWLIMDQSQYINGMINNATVLAAPSNREYKFLIQATDSDGHTSTTPLTVKVPDKPFPASLMKLSLFVMATIDFEYDIVPQLIINTAIQNALLKDLNADPSTLNLYINIFVKIQKSMQIQIENCDSCDALVNLRIDQLQYNKEKVSAELPPEYRLVVISASKDTSLTTTDEFCGTPSQLQANRIEIPYCGNSTFKYDLRDAETDEIVNYLIEFPSPPEPGLPPDSWIWLVNYTFEFYPTVSQWQQAATFEPEYGYSILLPNGQPIGRTVRSQFFLVKDKEYETVDYKIILQGSGSRSENFDNYYISLVMNALIKLLGTGNGIHFVSFRVLQNTPFQFEVIWENCTLPADCTNDQVKIVNDILFSTSRVGPGLSLKSYFPPDMQIVDLDNKCKNTPPVSGPAIFLTIPVCGKFEYKLPDNITRDAEDGTNLKVTMTLFNGESLPRSSWIRYNPSTRTIYALPDDGILLSQQRRRFLLWFEDSGGLKTNLTVNIDTDLFKNVYYEIDIVFQSLLGTSRSYLDIQCKMLELISEYTERRVRLENYRVISFRQVGQSDSETYLLKYGVCSINQTMCKNEESRVLQMESLLKTSTNSLQQGFQRYISSSFTGTTIKREPSNILVNELPRQLKQLDVIVITSCQARRIDIRTVFVDDEDTLKYTLTFQNGSEVPKNYWIQVADTYLYVYPWLNVTTGTYLFSLVVRDSCDNQRSSPVVVNVQSIYNKKIGDEYLFGYTWTVVVNVTANKGYPDVFYLDQVKNTVLSLTRSGQTDIKIISYVLTGDSVSVTMGDCTIEYLPCDQAKVNQLINELFPSGIHVITPAVKKTFESFGVLVNITGNRQQTCGITPGSPDCPERLELNATYCEVMRYEGLADLCKDNGGLEYSIFTEDGNSLSDISASWVQFDSTKEIIYGYPLYKIDNTVIPTTEKYLLRVRNNQQKSRFVTVAVNLVGEAPNTDYRLSVIGNFNSGTSGKTQVDERICIGEKLAEFFDRTDISNIEYDKITNGEVTFKWTFCRQRKIPCECSVIRESQNRLENRVALENKMSMCSFSVRKTSYLLYDECEATDGPRVQDKLDPTEVKLGQTYEKVLRSDMFEDAEDGGIVNMTMYLTDMDDERLKNAVWMRIDDEKLCGLMAFKEFVREGYDSDTTKQYKMVAQDSCGKTASSEYTMVYRNHFPTLFYRIIFIFEMPYGNQNCSTVNEILETVADYSDVPKSDIFVRDFRNSSNGTYMEWGIRKFTGTNCDNEEFELYREKFLKDGKGNEVFLQRIEKKGYPLLDIYDRTDIECHEAFPWWILILILVFLLLFLLMWGLWCLIPRCCPGYCSRVCPGCTSCCSKGGRYSSMSNKPGDPEDGDLLGGDPNDGGDKVDGESPVRSLDERDVEFFPDPVILPPINPSVNRGSIRNDVIDGGGFTDIRNTDQLDGGFRTESWKDKRPNEWGKQDRDITDIQTGNRYLHDNRGYSRDRIEEGRSTRYFMDDPGPTVFSGPRPNPGPRRSRQAVERIPNRFAPYNHYDRNEEYFYYHNDRDHYNRRTRDVSERIYDGGPRRRPQNVTTSGVGREPIAMRIRRSDLRDYVRRKGRRFDDNFYLTEKDLNELIAQRDSRVYRSDGYDGRQSRLTDALVDRKVVRRYNVGNNYTRHYLRRHSLDSLTELQPRRSRVPGNRYMIKPLDVHFKIQTNSSSSSPYETATNTSTYTSTSGPTERLYLVDSNYFKDLSPSSSLDDMVITPMRSVPMYKRQNRYNAATTTRINNNNSHGSRYTSRRTTTSGSRYNTSRRTSGYRNQGYAYDESSV